MANVLLGIHCVVPGCLSTLKRVNQWKAKACYKPKHKGKSHAQCMCPEPYQFFKFPSEVKLQKLWLERVKRPDLEVNNLTRVCSFHFVEGRPTRRHYFPSVNFHQEDDEADNEEEMEDQQHFYDEGEHDRTTQQAAASPQKKGRSGTVSIVPMELLQEQGEEEDGADEQQVNEDEEYEGNLTISRFNYHGNQGGAYEIPTNSVTITRVTSAPTTAVCTKPSNRFINTKKTRVETSSAAGNRFLRTSGTASSPANLARTKSQPVVVAPPPLPPRPSILAHSKSNTKVLRSSSTGGRTKVIQQTRQEEDDCPYDIDMVEGDDDDGDSSELSDIGIDIQPTTALKPKYTNKDISTAKTLSSLVVSRQHTIPPPQKETTQTAKPKFIPVLAVAPKSQLQQQGSLLQPTTQQTTTRATTANLISQQNKKPSNSNVLVATTSAKPIVTTSSGLGNAGAKTVIAVAGSSSSVKTEPITTTVSANSTSSSSANNNAGQQPLPVSSTAPSLATYDPTKQQLQIANPVKYIQECHMRIAQLLADKQNLESRNNDLEARVQELQKSNNDLRREIVHQALNAARRTPQQLNTPTFNLVPTAIMETTSSSVDSQNGNGSDSTNGGSNNNKSRIRYVIRRPTNLTSATNSTK